MLIELEKKQKASGVEANPMNEVIKSLQQQGITDPVGLLKTLSKPLAPAAAILDNSINGLAEIYVKNRPHSVDLMKTASDPLINFITPLLALTGNAELPEQLRTTLMKTALDNTDNAAQFVTAVAKTVPNTIKQVHQAPGLIRMDSLFN